MTDTQHENALFQNKYYLIKIFGLIFGVILVRFVVFIAYILYICTKRLKISIFYTKIQKYVLLIIYQKSSNQNKKIYY